MYSFPINPRRKRLREVLVLGVLALLGLAVKAQTKPDINRYTSGTLPTSRLNAPGVAGLCLETDGNGAVTLATCAAGGGSGTVTSFSAGNLSPLFTTSVATATTTPALTFALSNAAAHTFLGNNTGATAAPGYVAITAADLPGVFAQTLANAAHKWLNSYNAATGLFTQTQPDYSDLTSLPTLPANTAGTLHQFFTAYNSSTGAFTKAQPDYSDLTGAPTLPATLANAAHKWFNSYSSVTGLFTQTQPDYSDLTGVPSTFAPTAHNLLSTAHGDTTAAAAVRGDGIFAIGATPTWQRLAHPAVTGGYFKWNGTDIVASSGAASGTGSPTSCTNQFVTAFALNADAAPTSTCSTVAYAQVSGTPTLPSTLANAAHKWLNSYSSITGLFTQTQPDYSDLTGTPTLEYQTVQDEGAPLTQRPAINFTGAGVTCADNAGASRTDCTISGGGGAGSGTVTNTAGALTSGQLIKGNGGADITVGDLSGDATTSGSMAVTVAKVNGTTVPTNSAADQTVVTTASAIGSWASLPACTDAGGNHLNYDTSTHTFSCGTSASASSGLPLLGCANISVAGTTVGPVTVSGLKILLVIFIAGYSGSDAASLQFNNSGISTAYRYRWLTSAAGGTTFSAGLVAASTDRIKIGAANTTNSRNVDAIINNSSAVTEKLVMFINGQFGTNSAGTQSTIDIGNGAWISAASSTITSISIVSTSNMLAGSKFCAYQAVP